MTKKLLIPVLSLSLMLIVNSAFAVAYNNVWRSLGTGIVPSKGLQQLHPSGYVAFYLDENTLQQQLASLPTDPDRGTVMDLPTPDGSFRSFKVWQSSEMAPGLAAKYPQIKTFTAVATDNKMVTAKLDFTLWGFHAMVYDDDKTYLIDPYSFERDGYYLCYFKKDYPRPAGKNTQCNVTEPGEDELLKGRMNLTYEGNPQLKINGTLKRTFRLALACTGEYANAVTNNNPTKAGVLSAMTTSLNRINGIFERELSMQLQLVSNDDQLIYLDGNTDPYTNGSIGNLQAENQTNCDNVIGTLNYDLGHIFSTFPNGGSTEFQCACNIKTKASSATGQTMPVGDAFDIDFVIHEMGHEFGAHHTFNSSASNCGGINLASQYAYEPGGGTTIMAYAGICAPDNVQMHSDDYFHLVSLREISDFITTGTGGTCGSSGANPNVPATVNFIGSTYYIPYLTPFELTAPDAIDIDHDSLTYCWEEWDLGDAGKSFFDVHVNGPIFRSFKGTYSPTRVFPRLDMVRGNVSSYLGEKLPDVDRALKFRYTVRDMLNGWGCFNISDDSMILLAVNTGTPFAVKYPNASTDYWQIGSSVTVTWDVAKTDQAPISTPNVDIYLSLDDGQTDTIVLATSLPNTGSATITVPPNTHTNTARVKVKGNGNIFFDISNAPFVINDWPASVAHLFSDKDIALYPNPAKDVLHINIPACDYKISVTNAIGQTIWQGSQSGNAEIGIAGWASGVYNARFTDGNGSSIVKRFSVQ